MEVNDIDYPYSKEIFTIRQRRDNNCTRGIMLRLVIVFMAIKENKVDYLDKTNQKKLYEIIVKVFRETYVENSSLKKTQLQEFKNLVDRYIQQVPF